MHRNLTKIGILALLMGLFAALAGTAMAQTGGAKGKVRDQRGRGIANATVEARQEGEVIKSVRSNNKGDFVLTGLKPGVYNFAFDADGFATGVKFNVRIEDKTVDLGDRLILSVDQGSLVIIRGSVFFKEGTSVPGAKVELFDVRKDGSTKRLATGYTNYSGDFGFRQPDGVTKMKVVATYKGVSNESIVDVAGAAVYRTAITLDLSRKDN